MSFSACQAPRGPTVFPKRFAWFVTVGIWIHSLPYGRQNSFLEMQYIHVFCGTKALKARQHCKYSKTSLVAPPFNSEIWAIRLLQLIPSNIRVFLRQRTPVNTNKVLRTLVNSDCTTANLLSLPCKKVEYEIVPLKGLLSEPFSFR